MGKIQFSFRRYEKKYLLTQEQYALLLPALQARMDPDSFAEHCIRNVYFDTRQYDLIRNSIESPVYKEKLRLRSYGLPAADDPVYLELKKKFDGIVYKRRVAMTLPQARRYLQTGEKPETVPREQLMEFDWFLKRHPPERMLYICYERTAFIDRMNSELRITFDSNIHWSDSQVRLDGTQEGALLPLNGILMEIKVPGTIDLWLAQLLSRYRIRPASFSKYGTVYRDYLLPALRSRNGGFCHV